MNNYDKPYSLRFKPGERAMLQEVARRLERSQQDTIRFLVRNAHQVLKEQKAEEAKAVQEPQPA